MAAIEHMGLGLALKRFAPGVHLAVLMIATEALDIIYIILAILGIENLSYAPWTHTLLAAAVWSVLAGIAALLAYRKMRAGIVIGLLVFSHWVVDFITHPMSIIIPGDSGLQLVPGGTVKVGLGLYRTLPGLILFWLLLVGPGVVLYTRYRRAGSKIDPRSGKDAGRAKRG